MRAERRFSQVIAEGDGISLVLAIDDAAALATAEEGGADAVVVSSVQAGAGELPVLVRAGASPDGALAAGADAWVLPAERTGDLDRLGRLYEQVVAGGLDCVVEVVDEEQLAHVLERVDPEVFLLSSREHELEERLEEVLSLLHDVPAGKLAVADLGTVDRDTLGELERAGFDAVIVQAGALAELAAG
jgi:hypothetical protein